MTRQRVVPVSQAVAGASTMRFSPLSLSSSWAELRRRGQTHQAVAIGTFAIAFGVGTAALVGTSGTEASGLSVQAPSAGSIPAPRFAVSTMPDTRQRRVAAPPTPFGPLSANLSPIEKTAKRPLSAAVPRISAGAPVPGARSANAVLRFALPAATPAAGLPRPKPQAARTQESTSAALTILQPQPGSASAADRVEAEPASWTANPLPPSLPLNTPEAQHLPAAATLVVSVSPAPLADSTAGKLLVSDFTLAPGPHQDGVGLPVPASSPALPPTVEAANSAGGDAATQAPPELTVSVQVGARLQSALPMRIEGDGRVALSLQGLLALVQHSLGEDAYAALSSSSQANKFVTLDTLRASGIAVHYDASRNVVVMFAG